MSRPLPIYQDTNPMDTPAVAKQDDRERMLDVWLGLTGRAPLPRGPLLMPVLSGSMRPQIPVGSRLRIRACTAADCRIGDVAVYLEEDKLVAHRVLWLLGGRLFMKGDANRHGHWVKPHRVRGVVAEVLPPDDVAGAFPGRDPFSVEAAHRSRRAYLRDQLLVLPRLVRDLLTGNRPENGEPS